MAWQRVGSVADVQLDAPLAVTVGEKQLAVYRIGDDFYALDDVCPHAFALLSSGFVEGDKVECPLHQALFHIPTGKAVGPPCTVDIRSYAVKVDDGAYANVLLPTLLRSTGLEPRERNSIGPHSMLARSGNGGAMLAFTVGDGTIYIKKQTADSKQ